MTSAFFDSYRAKKKEGNHTDDRRLEDLNDLKTNAHSYGNKSAKPRPCEQKTKKESDHMRPFYPLHTTFIRGVGDGGVMMLAGLLALSLRIAMNLSTYCRLLVHYVGSIGTILSRDLAEMSCQCRA